MKLEKREITLNEYDSLWDMRLCAENLLALYARASVCLLRKETRSRVKTSLSELLEVVYTLTDLLNRDE